MIPLLTALRDKLIEYRNLLLGEMITYPLNKKLFLTTVSQAFGVRNGHYRSGIHNGTDFAVVNGTPLMAPCNNTEVYWTVKNHKSMGNACYLRFTYEGKTYWMAFLHLKTMPAKGVYNKGAVFGYSGNTGDSDGYHAHIELWKVPVDRSLLSSQSSVLKNLLDPVAWFKSRVG